MTISLQPENFWKDRIGTLIESFRLIARRQHASLLRRMESARYPSVYEEEIEKLVAYEQERKNKTTRGAKFD